ncbi:MAG: dicarboxylate/amino acid:cation symporter [Holosporales bacterium]|nr:dicarboxylate/amino acid:cation symporter [Holosporales bacterium]
MKRFGMPVIFLASLLFSLVFGGALAYEVKSFMYAVSLVTKELLVFSLPFVVFALISNSIIKLGAKALGYVVVIVALVCASNFMNTMLSYLISTNISTIDVSAINANAGGDHELFPMFTMQLGTLISNDIAIVFGALLGLGMAFWGGSKSEKLTSILSIFTGWFFKVLVPLMPLFIMGTAVKLQHDGMLTRICQQYLPILLVFVVSAYGYVVVQFFALARFSASRCLEYIRNVFPALVAAFGSMSSTVAMPLSIKGAEKNLDDGCNAGIIIPATVNIHLVGDCFFIPSIAIAVMVSFGMQCPGLSDYLPFALHFVLAKFAVAAVPGGGVLVMLPVMQKYLGLSSEMLALVTAVYVLFDPLITTCNVAGNGALAIAFEKVVSALKRKKKAIH